MIAAREKTILDRVAEAWEVWLELPDKHPDDLDEFRYAVHQIQLLVAYRVARRAVPEVFGPSGQSPVPGALIGSANVESGATVFASKPPALRPAVVTKGESPDG